MPTFLLEEDHNLPLCKIQVTVRTGASMDGLREGRTLGLCHFATELMRRGAGGKNRATLDAHLDRLGASLSVMCGYDAVTFDLLVLKEKLPEALPILADVLLRPDFEASEAALLKREIIANLDELRDDDSSLVSRFFSKALYSPHPYGNPIEGTMASIPQLEIQSAQTWHQEQIVSENLIFGAAGDITAKELQDIFQQYFSELRTGEPKDLSSSLFFPSAVAQGHQVLLIDKPDRTQSQIMMGQLAPKWSSKNWLPLHIASTAFGGTFTARLMNEVRVKRGLSYGASSYIGKGRDAQGLVIHVFPSAQQTVETIELVLALYQEWSLGLGKEEVDFAKSYLAKSYAFAIQTPEGRLRRRTQLELCGLPQEEIKTFPAQVTGCTPEEINETLKTYLRPHQLLVVLLASAEYMQPELEKISALNKAHKKTLAFDSY